MAPMVGRRLAASSHAPQAPAGLAAAIDGRVLEAASARGKHLLLALDDGRTVHSHLRMSGSWHVYGPGEPRRRGTGKAWLELRADGRTALQFGGPVLQVLDRARLALHPALRELGPDLLDDDPQIAVAVERARTRLRGECAIGEVLLDQSVAAGIGNIVRCEALYAAAVDPWAPLGAISDGTLAALLEQARRILQAGVRSGGPLPQAIYGRKLCRKCGGIVHRRGQGEQARTVHWCPACQKLQTT
jgi:endonuclease-8